MKKNIIRQKSYEFSVEILRFVRKIQNKEREYTVSNQLLRSVTSIGANIEESIGAQSDKDFLSKISIAYKEAKETEYWLRLLKDARIFANVDSELDSLLKKSIEISKILGSIQFTLRKKVNS